MAKYCVNPKCAKEIPTLATFCSFCGSQQFENENLSEEEKMRKEMGEMQSTIQLLQKALSDAQQSNDSSEENLEAIEELQNQLADIQSKNTLLEQSLTSKTLTTNEKKPFPYSVLIVGLVLIFIIGGFFGYYQFYKPYILDKNADRYYTFASNTFLRSSPEAGVEYNKLGTLPYGSELITYSIGHEWALVKWENPHTNESIKGYIASSFILSVNDFYVLNNIWGDNDSKEIINTSKCRLALLYYLKDNGYSNEWKVFSKSKNIKPNTTYYERVLNKNSKFTDFAVIIKNINTSKRKLLLFSFEEDETPYLIYEENAPYEGDIASIRISGDNIYINYSR